MPLSVHELIFKQWESSLSTRDRSWSSVQLNFEELFYSLKESGLESTSAYDFVSKAIKAHSPNKGLIRFQYRKTKSPSSKIGTEKEFEDSWLAGIVSKANVAFFNIYPQQIVKKVSIMSKNLEQEFSEFVAEEDNLTLN
jgi:hypothetical protein